MFLCSRTPSASAVAQQALNQVWQQFLQLPVYKQTGSAQNAGHLFDYMREHPAEVDDMVTAGTERNRMMRRWLERLDNFPLSLEQFIFKTQTMLDDYYGELPRRSASAYAGIYGYLYFSGAVRC